MDKLIRKIIEIDKKAQEIADEANSASAGISSETEAEIKKIRSEYDEKLKAELDRREQQAAEPQTGTAFDGGQIVRNIDLNRLQILFDDIPSADTRAALKQNGFRWSPKNQAWQRQLTDNAERAAKSILKID